MAWETRGYVVPCPVTVPRVYSPPWLVSSNTLLVRPGFAVRHVSCG